MLYSFPTKRVGAMTLAGDYLDLSALHEAVHQVLPELRDEEGAEALVLGLAYDIRKAKDGMRDKVKTRSHADAGTEYLGVKLPLLRAVLQVVYLRGYLAEYPTSPHIIAKQKKHLKFAADFEENLRQSGKQDLVMKLRPPQTRGLTLGDRASLLQFEAAVAVALEEAGIADGAAHLTSVEESVRLWKDEPDQFITEMLDFQSLYVATTKAKRVKLLKELPVLIRPGSRFSREVQEERAAVARDSGVPVDRVGVQWPDTEPKW
jgi:hypothetical protein